MFREMSARVHFPSLEEAILKFWQENGIFRQSLERRQGGPAYVFYEGPPTANGLPHIGHALTRVFKDLFPRYKTMQGYYCLRKGGWDTHGLPVEIEVEKELGFTQKQAIEEYGVAAFNQKCRESVFRYVAEWRRLTDRIGFWIDMDQPYVTLDNGYIETIWWILKRLWDRGLLYQDYKVVPYCPRCGTALSSHEVSLGYEQVEDPSIYVKFELADSDEKTYLLSWTTTPWTLPGNVALAVHPDLEYALVEAADGQRLILAQALLREALGSDYQLIASLRAQDLIGKHYRPLYSFRPLDKPAHRVLAAAFVSAEEGTGIVHIAPAYGEEDMQLGKEYDLPVVETVDPRGRFVEAVSPWAGMFVKEADPQIIADLQGRGLLYRSGRVVHTYPFCWRCETPLLYYAKTAWFARRTAIREELLRGNEQINWYPQHIQRGRYGNFLENIVDWALSRERYWGTPLPIWGCGGCGAWECVGSVAELRAKAQSPERVTADLELHRPFVDEIVLRCPRCQGEMRRVPEVIDCWFDSGAMPYAQWHYPFENQELFQAQFPADFICEAIDQTRGWFLSLHVISTFMDHKPSFKNCVCLELVLDAQGEKMSKSKGNVVDPWTVIDVHGADALRWYLLTASPPGSPRRFSAELVGEAARRFMATSWNTYAFFVTYANIDRWELGRPIPAEPDLLDRWVLSELHRLVREVTQLLDNYDPTAAGRAIEAFVDALSNWYVRRSRRRFWKSENDADKAAAYHTLYRCLATLAQLLAPFIPFLSEELYQNLVRCADASAPLSVHLTDYPKADPALIDKDLMAEMRLAMRLVSLGRAARSKAGVKVRQPLSEVLVYLPSPHERRGPTSLPPTTDATLAVERERAAVERLQYHVLGELNAKELRFVEQPEEVFTYTIRPKLNLLGPRFGRELPQVLAALKALDPAAVLQAQRTGQPIAAGAWTISPEEVEIETREREGLAAAEEAGYLVAVRTVVTPELAAEGLARELVRRIQTMRKAAGFRIEDHIFTYYQGGPAIRKVMEEYGDYIKQETLSLALREGPPDPAAYAQTQRIEGHQATIAVVRASEAS